jgi:hypothetical protein
MVCLQSPRNDFTTRLKREPRDVIVIKTRLRMCQLAPVTWKTRRVLLSLVVKISNLFFFFEQGTDLKFLCGIRKEMKHDALNMIPNTKDEVYNRNC